MTRIYHLIPARGEKNAVIRHESTGTMLVLSPGGACYQSPDTDQLRNLAPARGILQKSGWRLATGAEIAAHRWNPGAHLVDTGMAPLDDGIPVLNRPVDIPLELLPREKQGTKSRW